MSWRSMFVSSLCVAFVWCVATGAETAKPVDELETLMCDRGKLLFTDDFEAPLGSAWKAARGKWDVVEGSIQGAELKSENHGAVIRTNLKFHDAIIQYDFKLQGAKATSLSINDAKGHNSRVAFNAAGFSARKDDHDHAGPDEAVVLQAVKTPIADGEWHTVVVEIHGAELLARLDGKHTAYGTNSAIDIDKTNIGLTVGGETVSFKHLRIWEGTPKADWETTRGSLKTSSK